MPIQITVWWEPEEPTPQISRRQLANQLGIHYNTLRKYELLVKQWIPDASGLYRQAADRLEGIPLTPYLTWLLIKICELRRYSPKADIATYLFQNPKDFTHREFLYYVESNLHKVRNIKAA